MKTVKIALLGLFCLLNSCASVKFYSDAAVKNETGIKVYTSKPYLLVEYNIPISSDASKKGKTISSDSLTVKTTMVYLPDMGNPQYIKFRSGIGSSDLKLSLSNSVLTSYGLTADTKIPDTITALTGLVTGVITKASAPAITKSDEKGKDQTGLSAEQKPGFELYEIIVANGLTSLRKVEVR